MIGQNMSFTGIVVYPPHGTFFMVQGLQIQSYQMFDAFNASHEAGFCLAIRWLTSECCQKALMGELEI